MKLNCLQCTLGAAPHLTIHHASLHGVKTCVFHQIHSSCHLAKAFKLIVVRGSQDEVASGGHDQFRCNGTTEVHWSLKLHLVLKCFESVCSNSTVTLSHREYLLRQGAILCWHHLVWNHVWMVVAHSLLTLLFRQVVHALIRQEGHRDIQHGDVDVLPQAGVVLVVQCCKDSNHLKWQQSQATIPNNLDWS